MTAEFASEAHAAKRPFCQSAIVAWLRYEGPYAGGCCLALLICVLVARPFGNTSFIDDWSYSHLALKLAATGRLQYDGYASPMLLFQAIWGAAWIRLLGFSFDLIKLITLPFSIGFVLLVYLLGRKAELDRNLTSLGALCIGTSPLFLPFAASFMTEPYCCFFTALSLYAAICCMEAKNGRWAKMWLWTLAISGILGGSDRQTVWAAPLALIPYLYWKKRPDRRFSLHAMAAYLVCTVTLLCLVHWFTPPYALFELSREQLVGIVIHNSASAAGMAISFALTCVLFVLPGVLCYSVVWRDLGISKSIGLAVLSLATILILMLTLGPVGAAPFSGGVLSQFGILIVGQDALGFRPVVLSPAIRLAVSVLVVYSAIAFGILARPRLTDTRRAAPQIFGIFSCAYISFLIPTFLLHITYDRYGLPLLPPLIFFCLSRYQTHARRAPIGAWICLVVFGAYAVITTHDYGSEARARVQAAQLLEKSGIPRDRISAGFEYDGWTQLKMTGRMRGVGYRDDFVYNATDKFWFWNYTTDLRPEYVVLSSRNLPLNSALPSVAFSSWTPPLQRYAVARRHEDLPKGKTCDSLTPCVFAIPE